MLHLSRQGRFVVTLLDVPAARMGGNARKDEYDD